MTSRVQITEAYKYFGIVNNVPKWPDNNCSGIPCRLSECKGASFKPFLGYHNENEIKVMAFIRLVGLLLQVLADKKPGFILYMSATPGCAY